MACLAGRLITEPRLENPTLVMVTDRQDLDGQLFGVFASAGELLGETPKQADSRSELRKLLGDRPSGGIIFTTIQKFGLEKDEEKFPVLTDRHNIIVIADEAQEPNMGSKQRSMVKQGKSNMVWQIIKRRTTKRNILFLLALRFHKMTGHPSSLW